MIEEGNGIDLPSLTSFTGSGNNFMFFGSVVLDSIYSSMLLSRHPFTVIQQHSFVEFLLHVFTSIIQFACVTILTNRFNWTRKLYQFQTVGFIVEFCNSESSRVEWNIK